MFRWFAFAVVVGCFGISGFYRRRARRAGGVIRRREEGALLAGARALVALPLFAAVAAYLVRPASMAWAAVPLPPWARWLGVALGALTIPAAHWVFRTLGNNVSETVLTRPGHELVTSGPYRWVRHPLYTTGVTLFLAVGLLAANGFILAFTALTLVLVRGLVIPREERELVRRFGDAYRGYAARTGVLLPRGLWRR